MSQRAVDHIVTGCGILAQYEQKVREVNFCRRKGT